VDPDSDPDPQHCPQPQVLARKCTCFENLQNRERTVIFESHIWVPNPRQLGLFLDPFSPQKILQIKIPAPAGSGRLYSKLISKYWVSFYLISYVCVATLTFLRFLFFETSSSLSFIYFCFLLKTRILIPYIWFVTVPVSISTRYEPMFFSVSYFALLDLFENCCLTAVLLCPGKIGKAHSTCCLSIWMRRFFYLSAVFYSSKPHLLSSLSFYLPIHLFHFLITHNTVPTDT
jgi:hypothetical protein